MLMYASDFAAVSAARWSTAFNASLGELPSAIDISAYISSARQDMSRLFMTVTLPFMSERQSAKMCSSSIAPFSMHMWKTWYFSSAAAVAEHSAYLGTCERTVAAVVAYSDKNAFFTALFIAVCTCSLSRKIPREVVRFAAVSSASALKVKTCELFDDAYVALELRHL